MWLGCLCDNNARSIIQIFVVVTVELLQGDGMAYSWT